MKKTISIILILAMIVALAACGSTNGGGATKAPDETKADSGESVSQEAVTIEEITAPEVETDRKTTANSDEQYDKITLSLNSEPASLTPNMVAASANYFIWQIYECLFDLYNGEYIPAIAKGYTIVDATHWDVEIWDDVVDSAGNEITADDVVASYNWTAGSGQVVKYDLFGGVEKKDDYHVTFTWTSEPVEINALEKILCSSFIVDESYLTRDDIASGCPSSAPYQVKEYVGGSKIVLEAVDDYWGKDKDFGFGIHKQNVKEIEYDIITEAAQAAIALKTGAIDFSDSVASTSVPDFMEGGEYADDFVVTQSPEVQYYVACYNMYESRLTSDENLRKALCYALDNSSIYKAVSETMIPAFAFGSPAYDDYYAEWESLDNCITNYDVDVAKDYLSKSGYKGETLVMIAQSNDAFKNLLTLCQALWTAIGVNTEIKLLDQATLSEEVKKPESYDIYFRAVGGQNLVGSWNMIINYDSSYEDIAGYKTTVSYCGDTAMFEQYAATNTAEGHTYENMTKLMNMAIDNAYVYPLCINSKTYIFTKDIAEFGVYQMHNPQMNSCTYYLD